MRVWCLLVLSALAVLTFANPILVRWDEFAICLRRRLKRQFSPNVICATRKMASNFRRSVRCPGCEKFFHCQANYEAVFHCSQAPEAIQTAEVFSDCREYAELGGPSTGTLSDRQKANIVGRRGGDCVGEFLTKSTDINLISILSLGAVKKCQWNPFENNCDSVEGEVIASADYPPLPDTTKKPHTIVDSGHVNNVASSFPASFSLESLINFTQPLLGLNIKPFGTEKAQNLLETLQTLNTIKIKLPSLASESNESIANLENYNEQSSPTWTEKPIAATKPPKIAVLNSDSSVSVVGDPLFDSIASAFGSFFGKPPVLGDENQTVLPINRVIPSQQRPQPVVIPLNEDFGSPFAHTTQTSARPENQNHQSTTGSNQGGSSRPSLLLFPSSETNAGPIST